MAYAPLAKANFIPVFFYKKGKRPAANYPSSYNKSVVKAIEWLSPSLSPSQAVLPHMDEYFAWLHNPP